MRIGILSGIGALAGSRFYDLLIRECQNRGARVDSDFPEIVMFNMASKGMDEKGIADEDVLKRDLVNGNAFLCSCGAQRIVMACNTVHIYQDFLQSFIPIPIIGMPQAVARCLSEDKIKRVGVLSSRSTRDFGLYKNILNDQGIDVLEVDDHTQVTIDNIIGNVIGGIKRDQDELLMYGIISDLFRLGAERIVLGCTELPLTISVQPRVIDAGECVIREVLS